MSEKGSIYLRAHSYYGFLESMISPEALVRAARKNHVQTLGLTDHLYLTGAIEFYEACLAADIKPILGLEIDAKFFDQVGRLTLYAKDQEGWVNLSALSSHTLTQNKYITKQILFEYKEGLICLLGGPQGILRKLITNSPPALNQPAQLLTSLRDAFNQDCFIEIQRYATGPLKNERELRQLSQVHKIPILASQNIHYLEKQDQNIFRTLTAIKKNITLHGLSKRDLPEGDAAFPTVQDFVNRYQDLQEAVENLQIINHRCDVQLPIGQTHYPKFPTPQGESQSKHLRKKAYLGAKEKYGRLSEEITQRLDYELEIITNLGYEPIFLIVEDVLNHARQLGIPTSSRGSAASSLVAHCLNITSPDPLALNLYFERFLNPARKKPPDIDTDIDSNRRDEVIQYVFDTYGKDKVALVGTINRYRPKSALGDVAKAYGLSSETIHQISKKLPSSFRYQRQNDTKNPFIRLLQNGSISFIKEIARDAAAILDLPRHLSAHPGGLIIAPFPITNLIPIVHSSSLGVNHTQFDLEGIEKMGMVKIDLLGIRGLTVLGEVANRIQSWRITDYQNGLEVLADIPKDDPETTQTVQEARTIGCFQIESPGMRATLREIKAKNEEDIMAALALYRPGPLRGGLRDSFVRRFRGEEPVTHIHTSLERLLENTLGVILYQEQVLRIAHELGGLSITQADILRRAMNHFDPGGVMDTLRQNFIAGAASRHNVPAETAERIWEMMAAFAGYGFPKAHAASYAQLAWQSAWCKTHFPAEFMSAVLGFGGGYYSQGVYLMEARRLKLSLNPPHINHAQERCSVKYPKGKPTLYLGLGQVRDLTNQTIKAIIRSQPFHSLEDFILRVDPQKKEAQNLIKCGALEGLTTIPQGLRRIEHQRPPGQMTLFSSDALEDDWGTDLKLIAQEEILGVSLSLTPFERHAEEIKSTGALTTSQTQDHIGERIKVAGMRQAFRRIRSRSDQMFAFLTLEDLDGALQVLISAEVYRKFDTHLREADCLIVEGILEEDQARNRLFLRAEHIIGLS
jgi:DNA-directed DNA polymerase III PolC